MNPYTKGDNQEIMNIYKEKEAFTGKEDASLFRA